MSRGLNLSNYHVCTSVFAQQTGVLKFFREECIRELNVFINDASDSHVVQGATLVATGAAYNARVGLSKARCCHRHCAHGDNDMTSGSPRQSSRHRHCTQTGDGSLITNSSPTINRPFSPTALRSGWRQDLSHQLHHTSSKRTAPRLKTRAVSHRVATEVNPTRDAYPRNNVVSIGTVLK